MSLSPPGPAKRIAVVAPSLAGVLRDRSNLIRMLTARGNKVLVAAASHLAGEVAALHHMGGEHRSFDPEPPGLAFFANQKVRKAVGDILASWRPDTVIVSGDALASLAATVARKAGASRIVTIAGGLGIGSDADRQNSAQRYRVAGKLSDAVIVHNREDARLLAASLKLNGAKVVVAAGDGVDFAAFPASPLPGLDRPLTFIMIANPAERAAIEAYVAAARTLAANGRKSRFELATDREAADDTALLTAEGVIFHGRAADPAALLSGAHVAVHLSADDGSPTALKQALAAGRPVVTLDVAGCREAIDERVNGCLVPPGDPEALVRALESFIVHRDLLPAEARAARVKAVQLFDCHDVLGPVILAVEGGHEGQGS